MAEAAGFLMEHWRLFCSFLFPFLFDLLLFAFFAGLAIDAVSVFVPSYDVERGQGETVAAGCAGFLLAKEEFFLTVLTPANLITLHSFFPAAITDAFVAILGVDAFGKRRNRERLVAVDAGLLRWKICAGGLLFSPALMHLFVFFLDTVLAEMEKAVFVIFVFRELVDGFGLMAAFTAFF
jgi:hypothetical protein